MSAAEQLQPGVFRYYVDGGYRVVILGRPGRKYCPAVMLTPVGVKAIKVPLADIGYTIQLKHNGDDYPIGRARKLFRQAAKRGPISKTARAVLRGEK